MDNLLKENKTVVTLKIDIEDVKYIQNLLSERLRDVETSIELSNVIKIKIKELNNEWKRIWKLFKII